MKYLNAIIILFMLLSMEGFCQDIEIPQTIWAQNAKEALSKIKSGK